MYISLFWADYWISPLPQFLSCCTCIWILGVGYGVHTWMLVIAAWRWLAVNVFATFLRLQESGFRHHVQILSCFRGICDDRRDMDWWMDLLTTYTHDLEVQVITVLLLISTIYKSPQHPLSCFQPDSSSPAIPWQWHLTVEILQLPSWSPIFTASHAELNSQFTILVITSGTDCIDNTVLLLLPAYSLLWECVY
jgi:hypothetical protein